MNNSVIIRHQDGLCVFEIETIELRVTKDGLNMEIETKENSDCVLGFLPPPSLFIENAIVPVNCLEDLGQEQIDVNIGVGWNFDEASKQNNVFRIYIGQHQSLDNNHLSIERISPTEIKISWIADAVDFNYYDERAKRNVVETYAIYQNV